MYLCIDIWDWEEFKSRCLLISVFVIIEWVFYLLLSVSSLDFQCDGCVLPVRKFSLHLTALITGSYR